jgi:DNA-binding transcriptional ArsR family regulator
MEVDVLLDQGEATATSLARGLPVTRRAVAQHLAVLGRAGLVEGGRRGREVGYVVRAKGLEAAARSMATVAARCDQRVIVIERVAESAAREQFKPEKDKEVWQ